MKAVILAGGRGTRLSEETGLRPKPMVEIGGRPILWHIMKIYAGHGVRDFIICLGYRGWQIKEYFLNYALHASDIVVDLASRQVEILRPAADSWRISLIDTGENTQTGGRLRRIGHLLAEEDAFCMTYGDGVANVDISTLIDFHRRHGRAATVTAVSPPGRFGSLATDGSRVSAFVEKPIGDGGSINGGFFVLSPQVLTRIAGDDTVWEEEPLRGLARDGELHAYEHHGFWQPMDTLRDRDRLERLWAEGGAPWRNW
ncbi:MAG: glucose-1-phosphate cytidylyltransferase [Desulfomicrobium sp.]|nr:glucose-1-phosphate cytidylyltransferase [Pseudomonadota bacterium]MBV1711564.1 glucose-1-phosphate cytidylyltransferase [Desulfomicrobium sp.]MBU4572977.1 glucose-1-phosphate cytidylyltransferase [Pseudomonadota bacterium]MBU4594705.1 glucose-1-phosphate cytidylyltransferase [Pseudomonadota bacterium]MBV1718841.1 glucose-1-phosphate cytidylyltransferase [Desulfomicrobium sp.]